MVVTVLFPVVAINHLNKKNLRDKARVFGSQLQVTDHHFEEVKATGRIRWIYRYKYRIDIDTEPQSRAENECMHT